MKQSNNIKIINSIESSEISDIYSLLMIKYKEDFSSKFAYEVARILYLNGIRAYMFFVRELDIDEIVNFVVKNKKVIKFCRKENVNLTNYGDEFVNNKNGEVICFNDYFRGKYRRIVRK